MTTTDELIEWRERLGVRLMFAMRCTHQGDDFGPKAVCVTCFDNVQRVGETTRRAAAEAWEQGRTADLATPDEERQPLPNPYHAEPSGATETEPHPPAQDLNTEVLRLAAERMRQDADTRWHPVAEWLTGEARRARASWRELRPGGDALTIANTYLAETESGPW